MNISLETLLEALTGASKAIIEDYGFKLNYLDIENNFRFNAMDINISWKYKEKTYALRKMHSYEFITATSAETFIRLYIKELDFELHKFKKMMKKQEGLNINL